MSYGPVVCLSCFSSYKGSPDVPHWGLLCQCWPFWAACCVCCKAAHTPFCAHSVCLDTRGSTVSTRWMSASSSPARMEGPASTWSITSSAPAHQEPGVGSSAIKWMFQKGEFSSLAAGFTRHSLKGMHSVLWRMFPKYTASLGIHIFSLKINAAFFPSLLIFFSFKGIGRGSVPWECRAIFGNVDAGDCC